MANTESANTNIDITQDEITQWLKENNDPILSAGEIESNVYKNEDGSYTYWVSSKNNNVGRINVNPDGSFVVCDYSAGKESYYTRYSQTRTYTVKVEDDGNKNARYDGRYDYTFFEGNPDSYSALKKYDSQNRLLCEESFDESGKSLGYTNNTYDSQNRLLSEDNVSSEDHRKDLTYYQYDSKGNRLIKEYVKDSFDESGKYLGYTKKTYDPKGRLDSVNQYNSKQEIIGQTVYDYGEDGSITVKEGIGENVTERLILPDTFVGKNKEWNTNFQLIKTGGKYQIVDSDDPNLVGTYISGEEAKEYYENQKKYIQKTRKSTTETSVPDDQTTSALNDLSSNSTTASTITIDEEEFKNYLQYYLAQPGHKNDNPEKIRKDYILAKSVAEKDESKYKNLDQYKEQKVFLTPKLSDIKKIIGDGNNKQVKAFVDFLTDQLIHGKLFTFDTTQFTGEASQAYQIMMETIKEEVSTLKENADIADQATELIEKELIPALKSLAELDLEREKLRKELAPIIKEYESVELKISKTEPKIEEKYKPDKGSGIETDKDGYAKRKVDNPVYIKLMTKKGELQQKIDELLTGRSVTIGNESVNGIEGLDELGEKLQEKCKKILGENTNLEALIKDFKKLYNGSGGSGGNSPPPGGGGGGGETPTEPLPELPDNTQDQMNYYQDLSIGDLSDISDNLTKFAETNNLTIQELLSDENNAEKLVEYLGTLGILSEDLKKLINEGDPAKTQELLKNIFTGKEATVVGLDSLTKNVVINKLNTLAASNNTTVEDLLSKEENAALIRKELSGYSDIASKLKSISRENMKSQLSNIYDGDGVDDYSGSTLKTLKDYIDVASKNNNQSVEEYLQSDASVKNMQNLGKTSVLLNTISGFDDKTLMSVIQTILK
ncbi:MAG: hypothetical protein IKQ33_05005 [Clostridia bacterium]|nr:hypothetical protein [Clostridia bacterium]